MLALPPGFLVCPVLLLLLLGAVPDRFANRSPRLLAAISGLLAFLVLLASGGAAVQVASNGTIDARFVRWDGRWPVCLGIHVDALAVVMMGLIAFLGLIICRFSFRYLLGDPSQGRFFRWLSFTLGATLCLVMSCNLALFTCAWMLTSFGLHRLLTYYPDRPWAIWAARKKFLISRLGDVFLITAVVLTYDAFGTTEFTEVFAAADQIHTGAVAGSFSTALISMLFALGAMTKSAQFPFHTWLPDTMETPTPVSALMHAGVINAGGFLVIRLSPLVALSPLAMDSLALVGAITALLGSSIMLTQTSIKRSLAYSTIAQMGFMMLQCGLGAFPAALLHIVAHSAYKAHAFLTCGSVLELAPPSVAPTATTASPGSRLWALISAVTLSTGIAFGAFFFAGIDFVRKPGGSVLGFVLVLALTQLLWNSFIARSRRGIFAALVVAAAYSGGYLLMERLLRDAIPNHNPVPSTLDAVTLALVVTGFIAVFAGQALSGAVAKYRWGRALYVHLLNAFYLDVPARRITALIYRQSAPVQ